VGAGVWVDVAVGAGVKVAVAVSVGVGEGSGVKVAVGSGSSVAGGRGVLLDAPSTVGSGVVVALGSDSGVGVPSAVSVGVAAAVGARSGVLVGVGEGIGAGVGVADAGGPAGMECAETAGAQSKKSTSAKATLWLKYRVCPFFITHIPPVPLNECAGSPLCDAGIHGTSMTEREMRLNRTMVLAPETGHGNLVPWARANAPPK